MTTLPIEAVLPDLLRVLREGAAAVLQAPPGAGKTTRVPFALRDEAWLGGRRIIVLEPRRLAARAAAHRMAHLLGEAAGQTVGYRVHMDSRVGPRTQVEVVTEGVLTRFLQDDPALEGVGAVIFDEYHERSVQADLGLALCLEAQAVLRPDLRLLVMSATLDGAAVAALLGDAPVVSSEGRSFPVRTRYRERRVEGPVDGPAAATVRRVLAEETGDVLVFLPGSGEIRRVERRLQDPPLGAGVDLHPLYGDLPLDAQDRAIAPSPKGRRKVVLATSIAETSLTIEGINVVVDAGLKRGPAFSPQSGMTQLVTRRVSKASADQRRGRAGRLGPGVCYRLWTRHEQQHLVPHAPPEILETDLAPLALELALWGTTDPTDLAWLDPPPEAAYAQARDLLRELGALDADGLVTPHGRRMAGLGLHPRLAHMVLRGLDLGYGALACDLAALLSERDVFKGEGGPPDVDLRLRLEALRSLRRRGDLPPYLGGRRVDRGALRHLLRVADHWRRRVGRKGGRAEDLEAAGLLVALAYPDRIAQRRSGQAGRFRMRNGRAAVLAEPQLLSDADYLAVAHVDGRRPESRVFLAAPVDGADLAATFADQLVEEDVVRWDAGERRVRARHRTRLGAVVLKEGPLASPAPEAVGDALLAGVAEEGLGLLSWTKAAERLRERLAFLHHHDPGWPDVSDEALLASLGEWLRPHLYGLRSADDLQRLDLHAILLGRLTWPQRAELDERAPTHVDVPSGFRRPIDYSRPDAPVLAVRLQEMFGATETPRIDRGRVPLTIHLLSPAQRPVQVTQDLANFWANTYFEVRKDLRGRYPKHYWPEDPLQAEATHRAKPR